MTKARTLADNYAADINQITASAPLTGGGTSGTVTVGIQAGTTAQSGAVQLTDSTASTSITTAATPNSVKSAYDLANGAIAKSLVDAKGDLLVGSANDTVSRLAVASTAGYVLTVDSAEATGLKWAAAAGGGKVLQVVQATYGSQTTISSTTFTDSNLSCSITPSSTSSKILVLTSEGVNVNGSNAVMTSHCRLVRGSTTILNKDYVLGGNLSVTFYDALQQFSIVYLDSPSTTSSTTYKTQYKIGDNTSSIRLNLNAGSGNTAVMVLMEIGA